MNDAGRPLAAVRANKSLGQHFLFDPNILDRVALSAGPVSGRTVIEVGPGPGGLTAALLRNGAAKVITIETDPRFADALRQWPDAADGRLIVIEGDALKTDISALAAEQSGHSSVMLIANLPYNVGTPLVIDWIKAPAYDPDNRTGWRGEMALMFQREVAERLCASPGDAHYGRLAVLAQATTAPHIALTLPPGAFSPPPKVESAVAVLIPLPVEQRFSDIEALEKVTGAAFGQRRKMLRASLRPIASGTGMTAQALVEAAGIDPTRRAETLTQEEFRRLALAWRRAGG